MDRDVLLHAPDSSALYPSTPVYQAITGNGGIIV